MSDEFLPTFHGVNFEHPMKTPPTAEEDLPAHIRALRVGIANRMLFLDGKPQYGITMSYLAALYEASKPGPWRGEGPGWPGFVEVLGQIAWQTIKTTDAINDLVAGLSRAEPNHSHRFMLLRQNLATINEYADQLSRAIVKDIPRS